jgi:hypothetical protein
MKENGTKVLKRIEKGETVTLQDETRKTSYTATLFPSVAHQNAVDL